MCGVPYFSLVYFLGPPTTVGPERGAVGLDIEVGPRVPVLKVREVVPPVPLRLACRLQYRTISKTTRLQTEEYRPVESPKVVDHRGYP